MIVLAHLIIFNWFEASCSGYGDETILDSVQHQDPAASLSLLEWILLQLLQHGCHIRCPSVIMTCETCSVPLNQFDFVDVALMTHCCPKLMMRTPAEVSQVFCNTADGYRLGSSRIFFWRTWGSEMLSLLWYQMCSFHVSLLLMWTPRYLAEVTVLRVVPWWLYFAFTDILFLVKVMASHLERLNSIS